MRLIDADELIDSVRIPMIDHLTNAIQLGQEYLYVDVPSITLTQISNAPTIEAIPISWIKSYVLSTGKAFLPFNAMINEWRRLNGQQ